MKRKKNHLRRNLDLMPLGAFLGSTQLFYPVAVLAYREVTGSFANAMGVFAVMGVSQALLEVPTGVLSDKVGRRMTSILGSGAETLGVVLLALSFYMSFGFLLLYAGAFFIGLSNALFSGNNDARLYETLSYYRRAREMPKMIGRIYSMAQIGLALSGILASALLLLGLNYSHLVALSVIPVCSGFIMSFFFVEPPFQRAKGVKNFVHMKESLKLIVRNPRLRGLAMAGALKKGLGDAAHNFTPGFVDAVWPAWLTPLYRTAQNALGAVSFWCAGHITKKFGLMKSLLGATVYSYIASGIAYATATLFSPALMLTSQISYAIGLTADSALMQENFSAIQRSTMGSLISLAGSFIGGLAAILAGVLADHFGPAESLLIILLLTAPAGMIYFRLYKAEKATA